MKLNFPEKMQTNMKVIYLYTYEIVQFLVLWKHGNFGLKKGTGSDPPKGDIVTFLLLFYCRASLPMDKSQKDFSANSIDPPKKGCYSNFF